MPLVSGHDTEKPLGVLVTLEQDSGGTLASFSVDETPAGDAALVQASSGSRAGLSAGAVATEWIEAAGGVLEVIAATLFHVGLVSIPALPSAQVSRVAAASAETPARKGGSMADQTPEELAASIGESTSDEELAALLEHGDENVRAAAQLETDRRKNEADDADADADDAPAAGQTTLASHAGERRERPVIHARRERGRRELVCSGAELVLAMVSAQSGNRQAQRLVEAALSEIPSSEVPGLMPPAYVGDILGEIPSPRPLADRVAAKRPMPATGMSFVKPLWKTKPAGGWVAELAATPSNLPEIDSQSVTVLEWAYGVAMSYAVATRSSPDAIETIYRAAVADYYSDVEQKLADALMSVDQPGGTGAGIGAAIAAFYGDEKAGPELLVCSPDIYGDLVDVVDTVPSYWQGSVAPAGLTGTIAGLEVVVSPHLPAGTELITARGVLELRETTPIRLTANVIGALKVELGITSFASFDIERPNGVHSLIPAAGAPAGSSAKRSSKSEK